MSKPVRFPRLQDEASVSLHNEWLTGPFARIDTRDSFELAAGSYEDAGWFGIGI